MNNEQKRKLLDWMCEFVYTSVGFTNGRVDATDPERHEHLYNIQITLDLLAKVELAVCEKYGLKTSRQGTNLFYESNYWKYGELTEVIKVSDVLVYRDGLKDTDYEKTARSEALIAVMEWAKKQEEK